MFVGPVSVTTARESEVTGKDKALCETYKIQATAVSRGANWHQSVPRDQLTGDKHMGDKAHVTPATSRKASVNKGLYRELPCACLKSEPLV